MGTDGGICRFNGRDFDAMAQVPGLPRHGILDIQSWKGDLLVLTAWQLLRFDGARFNVVHDDGEGQLDALDLDSKGRIWLTAGSQLVRIEGNESTLLGRAHGFPDHGISAFFEDKRGRVWVGFRHGGLVVFSGDSWKITRYGHGQGLPQTAVNAIFETEEGAIWVATHLGIHLFDGKVFHGFSHNSQLPTPIVYGIFDGGPGTMWFNLASRGLAKWDGAELTLYNQENGLVSNNIDRIHRDFFNRYWFVSKRGLGFHKDGYFGQIGVERGLASERVTCFLDSGDGVYWVGTSGGLSRLEKPRLDTFLEDHSTKVLPPSSLARTIVRDRQGKLWFPSLDGLGHFDGREFHLWREDRGLPSKEVHSLSEDAGGGIWVGTENGAALKQGPLFVPVALGKERSAIAQVLADRQGRVWILNRSQELWVNQNAVRDPLEGFRFAGTYQGAFRLHNNQKGSIWIETIGDLVQFGPPSREWSLQALLGEVPQARRYVPKTDTWWFGTNRGVARFRGGRLEKFSEINGLEAHAVNGIFPQREDAVWFRMGVATAGLSFQRIASGVVFFDGREFHPYDLNNGLLDNDVRGVFSDPAGGFWVTGTKGMSLYRDGKFQHLTVAEGLSGNEPMALAWDRDNRLWVATNGGLNKYMDGMLTTVSREDGLLHDVVLDIEFDENNHLWLRTRSGVQRYREISQGPAIRLVSIFDGQQPLAFEELGDLSYKQNDLVVEVSGIHLRRGADQTQFRYTLAGPIKSFSDVSRESKIRFPSLSPGAYKLSVSAYNRDLFASENPLHFTFFINSPLWKRPWFIGILIVLALLVVYGMYRMRLSGKLESARIVNELKTAHDMQMSLMPKTAPKIAGVDLFGVCKPTQEVGGDFFDYFWLDDGKHLLGFTAMDVSGKSMEAAIISVMTSGLVYSEIGSHHMPGEILSKINFPMYQKTQKQVFTTGLVAALNIKTRELIFANAGHMDPVVIRNGRHFPLVAPKKRDLPLGVVRSWLYKERRVQLLPGDLVLLYTDGLTEATTAEGKLFGETRLIAHLEQHQNQTSESLVNGLLEAANSFAGGAAQHDDITIIAIKIAV